MRRTSTTIQPYDRATGTELSPEQQEACQQHYTTIRAYINTLEDQTVSPLPWSRKILRCPTTELLDSIGAAAADIRQRLAEEAVGGDDTDKRQKQIVTGVDDASAPTVAPADTAQLYQHAVNLLHEFVSRFSTVSDPWADGYSPRLLAVPRDGQGAFAPGSHSNSSEASAVFSNPPASRTSYITSDSSKTDVTGCTDDIILHSHIAEEQPAQDSEGDPAANLASVFPTTPYAPDRIKHKVTNDWVLEYLRGGWLASSPTINHGPELSSGFSAEDTSPAASFHMLRRTDSDGLSAYGEDHTSRPLGSAPTTARKVGRGRPIPTVASRVIGRSSSEAYGNMYGFSTESGPDFFKTPRSIVSGGTVYCTPDSGGTNFNPAAQVQQTSAWNAYLREKGLIPNPFEEMDWSGRGQHAEFEATEESQIPLTLEKTLGHSATAVVESVRCRRIRLARKTMEVSRLRRRLTKEEAMKEVEHLQRLKHPHIIRVVGTYTLPRKLSILLYPVAEYTLDGFLESIEEAEDAGERSARLYSVSTFVRCLAKALAYIHENAMKHMDIKPKNLLIRDMRSSTICNQGQYKIYIADFGIARSYLSVDDCNTDTPTAFTKMYAAPEVVAQEQRDQKADIFSLGAVFAEILAVLADEVSKVPNLHRLQDIREKSADKSYQANISSIQNFIKRLFISSYGFESDSGHAPIAELVALMLSEDPADRPSAATVVINVPFRAFCCDVNGGAEPFEAADRPTTDRQLYDRAMEITEAELKYFRCEMDGCVKVFWNREMLQYHELNGHGGNLTPNAMSNYAGPSRPLLPSDVETHSVHDKTTKQPSAYDKAVHKELTQSLRWS